MELILRVRSARTGCGLQVELEAAMGALLASTCITTRPFHTPVGAISLLPCVFR